MTNQIIFSVTPFPDIQWSGDIAQLAQLLAEHLNGELDQSAFTGQAGGTEPLTDVGPWLKENNQWWYWDGVLAKYRPFSLVLGRARGDEILLTTIVPDNLNEDIQLVLPESGGTLATLDDARAPLPTLPRNNTAVLKWFGNTYINMESNLTLTDGGGGKDGQTVFLYLETAPNVGTAHTITFPAAWRKATGLTLSTTDATHRAVDRFEISRVGNDTFVSKTGAFQINQAGPDGDTTPPNYVSSKLIEGNAIIYLTFDEPVQVGSPGASAWTVKKNGTNIAVTNVTVVYAYEIQLTLVSAVPAGVELTVEYAGGTGVFDFAGNEADAFGPVDVDII